MLSLDILLVERLHNRICYQILKHNWFVWNLAVLCLILFISQVLRRTFAKRRQSNCECTILLFTIIIRQSDKDDVFCNIELV